MVDGGYKMGPKKQLEVGCNDSTYRGEISPQLPFLLCSAVYRCYNLTTFIAVHFVGGVFGYNSAYRGEITPVTFL